MNKPNNTPWKQYVRESRRHVTGTLRAVRAGAVAEDDLDQLHNFILYALALMDVSGMAAWNRAMVRAEVLEALAAEGIEE